MFNQKFTLGTVHSGPGKLRFFGFNTEQAEDFKIQTNEDDKLHEMTEYQISLVRRKKYNEPLNALEKEYFASTNSSIGQIGTTASPICSMYASYLQNKSPSNNVSHMLSQINILRKLKRLGTVITYPRPEDSQKYEMNILVFADASKESQNGQIGVLLGLLIGKFSKGSIFHTISWIYQKLKRSVKSVPAAEILAALEAIDEAKSISSDYKQLIGTDIGVWLCVDYMDLFKSMYKQRNNIERSIRSDVA